MLGAEGIAVCLPQGAFALLPGGIAFFDRFFQFPGGKILRIDRFGEFLALVFRHGQKPQSIGNTEILQR